MSRATVYSWFRGDTRPDAASISRLVQVLDASPMELLATFAPNEPVLRPSARSENLTSTLLQKSSDLSGAGRASARPAVRETRTIIEAIGARDVASCDADEPIGPVAQLLYENDYSQLPVRDRASWIGLLTMETIARWVAARSRRGLGFDETTPVREILPYAEDPDQCSVVPSSAAVDRVITMLDRAVARGRPMPAILVTDSGEPHGELLSIVTPFDLPRLRESRAADARSRRPQRVRR